ncbi:P-type conjugative transfer protein TrbJ [Janthinobacterium sp. PSPC3-1]|uniref:P-type conjugative transfer protein TrbJ n=1 Tax=Janthinobacterium sp. PSPC3-1 TaxID=2804653 RepID=UPI003CFAA341
MDKTLAAKILAGMALCIPAAMQPVRAGLPVIDASNLSQNSVSALENVAHTLKQIQQYRTQLQQYQNMLQNTAAPPSFIWDQATQTMNLLRREIDTLSYYKSSLGSIDAYLRKYRSTSDYRGSPCFSVRGCTQAEWNAMSDAQRLGSDAQKRSTDALFRGLDRQQDAMEADARKLTQLQAAAQGASGQMQAIGYANQLASQQATQLLQIRGLLISQQNVIATRYQSLADREAMQRASDEVVLSNTYKPSPARGW